MPSALETLVKILKLEREQGYKNTAVIGGLTAFSMRWTTDAHAQARKAEHHLLVDELSSILRGYDQVENKQERHKIVSYMLDRITGRVPPLPDYAPAVPTPQPLINMPAQAESPPLDRSPGRHEQRSRQEQREQRPPRRERSPQKSQRRAEQPQQQRLLDTDEGETDGKFDSDEGASRLDDDIYGGAKSSGKLDIAPMPRLARPPRRPRPSIDQERAADIMQGLNASVEKMKGIGPKMGSLLNRVGVETIRDLLYYLPRRYDDYTRLLPIRRLQPDTVATVIGTVMNTQVRLGRNHRRDFYMVVDDGSALMQVIFFGQHYLERYIRKGMQVVLSGITSMFGKRIQMVNPEWEALDSENLHTIGIVPVYPLTEGLYPRTLRKLIKQTVDYWADRIPDPMPEAILERNELADLGWMIRNLHFPEGWDHLHHAKRRYIFDQLLTLQLAIMANRRTWQSVPSQSLSVGDDYLHSFLQTVFPYELTGAQQRAIADIRADIIKEVPMNRLLQGDVGSGKTAVATTAIAIAIANGKQAAMMVPTGILAEQHYRNISRIFENWTRPDGQRIIVALLTSSLSNTEREAIYNGLADGSIDVVIGTHAVIQQGVQFNDLALAIIDEQHRFGVEQRGALRGKGTNPHLLVMTATPIPRTLALTLYADLDLSVIDEMPPGRIPIDTRVIEPHQRQRALNFVEHQLSQGRQAFIVFPLVEASEKIEAESAVENYEKLQKEFPGYRIGLLHGRMKPAEKDETMAAFGAHKFDLLVTTSVAEVGVDIPNATVMMIEGANRFGLAQLHQFRGRVGRGDHASYCLLVADTNDVAARERLQAMAQFNDGFKLAEIDWKLRGAGDLVGTRQSGRALLQMVEEMSPELVALAQREARTIFEEDPELTQEHYRLLAQRVAGLRDERSDVS